MCSLIQLEPISTLPGTFSRDPDFVGRDDVLKEMDEHFTTAKCVTLVGLGGIGYRGPLAT